MKSIFSNQRSITTYSKKNISSKNLPKALIAIFIVSLQSVSFTSFAQYTYSSVSSSSGSQTNGFYQWNVAANWTTNVTGPTTPTSQIPGTVTTTTSGYDVSVSQDYNSSVNAQITIISGSTISVNGNLSFATVGGSYSNSPQIVINGNLVVYGDMTFSSNSYDLILGANSSLIVLGNFSTYNKVDIANGGTIAITGNMTLKSGSTYTDSNGSGKNLYVGGSYPTSVSGDLTTNYNTLSNTNVVNFLNNGGTTPLPIVLSDFTAQSNLDTKVLLKWTTLTEENFDHFEVQRSTNGKDFEVIGTVKGHGFTSDPQSYEWMDQSPAFGLNYYRLRAIDFDGYTETFQVIAVEVKPDLTAVRLYPNPSSDGQHFQLDVPGEVLQKSNVTLQVSDMMGRTIYLSDVSDTHVNTQMPQPLQHGIYLVTIYSGQYSNTQRLVVN